MGKVNGQKARLTRGTAHNMLPARGKNRHSSSAAPRLALMLASPKVSADSNERALPMKNHFPQTDAQSNVSCYTRAVAVKGYRGKTRHVLAVWSGSPIGQARVQGEKMVQAEMLYSIVCELHAQHDTPLPTTLGQQAHALFLTLIKQFDTSLSGQLHDTSGFCPFTVSPLDGEDNQEVSHRLKRGQSLFLRITLLDGGSLWQRLSTHFLEAGPLLVSLGGAQFQLLRLFSTPANDPTGWAGSTSWQMLVSFPATASITMHFVRPTAFRTGTETREFTLVPHPQLVWKNLLRAWNTHAPRAYQLQKAVVNDEVLRSIRVTHCTLQTQTLHYSHSQQKGFRGSCTYQLPLQRKEASALVALAAFARYAGVGYKTTMGMGQVRVLFEHRD
jgi:CRISPR-associated endoribonuclease Cas6